MMVVIHVPMVLIYPRHHHHHHQVPLLNWFMGTNWESTQLLHRHLSSSDLFVCLTIRWFRSYSLVMFFFHVEKKERTVTTSHRVNL